MKQEHDFCGDVRRELMSTALERVQGRWMRPVKDNTDSPPDAVQLLTNYAIGGLASGLFFPLLLGLFWKRANEYGAIAGTVVGFVYFVVGSNVPAICFGLNAFVPAVLASGISMILVSLVTPKPRLGTIQVWFCKNYDKEFATGGRIKQ